MRFVVRLILYVEKTTDEVKNHVVGEKFADVLLQRLNCLRCRLNETIRECGPQGNSHHLPSEGIECMTVFRIFAMV